MLLSLEPWEPTPPTSTPSDFDLIHIRHAILQAKIGLDVEGGIPIGAALGLNTMDVKVSADGTVVGVGRNRRVQMGSPTRHGETDCLENIGRLPARMYRDATMFTTLSPCSMCAGAIILYGIKRVVIGENSTFVGGEDILKARGVEIINLDLPECKTLMARFIESKPKLWNEDIGQD